MKILLATPEIHSLTGATPLGQAAGRLAGELYANPESDAVIVLPATESILKEHAEDITDTGALISATSGGNDGPSARVFEFRASAEQQIYLLDSAELRHGFGESVPPETLANRALLWARFLAALIPRIKPRIHIVHCFGWECALVPPLLRARDIEVKTILTTSPLRGGGPGIAPVKEAVNRSRLSELAAVESESDDLPLVNWAGRFAEKISNLGEGVFEEEWSSPDPMADPASAIRIKQRARASSFELHEIEENALSTLFYIPATDPAPLLPLLDRLLATDARVILESRPEDPSVESALLAVQLRHPGKFALIKVESFLREEHDWFTASDFLVLLPGDADEPESAALVTQALVRGCTPVVPRRSHFDPVLPVERGADETPAAGILYRDESPEAIWCALKRCVRIHRDPRRWKEQVGAAVRAGLTDEGVAPVFGELYREVIESSLSASA